MISTRKLGDCCTTASRHDFYFLLRTVNEILSRRAAQVPTSLVPEGRRFNREEVRKRASLVVSLGGHERGYPCLILDSSPEGFRVRWPHQLRRGQVVKVILDEDPFNAVRCKVIWVAKTGSKQEGEAGLETV